MRHSDPGLLGLQDCEQQISVVCEAPSLRLTLLHRGHTNCHGYRDTHTAPGPHNVTLILTHISGTDPATTLHTSRPCHKFRLAVSSSHPRAFTHRPIRGHRHTLWTPQCYTAGANGTRRPPGPGVRHFFSRRARESVFSALRSTQPLLPPLSSAPAERKQPHKIVNECTWLCVSKTLFTKIKRQWQI